MMRRNNIWLIVLLMGMIVASGCQRNYYTSKVKGSDCGCPNKKGMVGY